MPLLNVRDYWPACPPCYLDLSKFGLKMSFYWFKILPSQWIFRGAMGDIIRYEKHNWHYAGRPISISVLLTQVLKVINVFSICKLRRKLDQISKYH